MIKSYYYLVSLFLVYMCYFVIVVVKTKYYFVYLLQSVNILSAPNSVAETKSEHTKNTSSTPIQFWIRLIAVIEPESHSS